MLTVISIAEKRHHKYHWNCICDCGKETIVSVSKITTGWTKSCGCLGINNLNVDRYVHGMRHSRFYGTWKSMINRCENPKYVHYKDYGGRGIKVCEEWKNSIQTFHDWCVANGHQEGLTLDRKDVNGNYEPNNCRWATLKQQANNTRRTLYVYVDGIKYTATEITEKYGMGGTLVHKYSTKYKNFAEAIEKWKWNKINVKNQWNTTRTIIKNELLNS